MGAAVQEKKRDDMKRKWSGDGDAFSRMVDFAIKHPDLAPDRVLYITGSKERIDRILSPARMALIRAIRRKQPKNISELAADVGRPLQSVSRDLAVLHNYGFLEFVQSGREKSVRLEKDAVVIPLTA